MASKKHWEHVYDTKSAAEVSWYRTHLDQSLALIRETGVAPSGQIIDVGGGASTLVDDLLAAGYRHLSVLDISGKALDEARRRLGSRASEVAWIEADITQAKLPHHHYDVWHDRAVFHFLTDPQDRQRYVAQVRHAVKANGHVIVASFGPQGPLQCSGLDIVRYRPDELHGQFGDEFQLLKSVQEEHRTPSGAVQQFVYCYCRKRD